MNLPRHLLLLLCFGSLFAVSALCQYEPPPSKTPDKETLKAIEEKSDKLKRDLERLTKLPERPLRDPLLADIEIFHKAAEWLVQQGEFYHKDSAAWTLETLERGLVRKGDRSDMLWLYQTGVSVIRGYRSAVDDSLQPYAVTFPANFGKGPVKKWRLEVVLHGRNPSLTEVAFIHQLEGKPAAKDLDHVRLDIYGRGNNAYRWAGEADVNEAIDNFLLVEGLLGRYPRLYDPARSVLRGFSMGGAGTWHLGLHRPDRWCVIGPGAGFTSTHGYIAKLPEKLPSYQEACLSIYDAVDYAENAAMVPVVAYGGSNDPQLQAARNIEARLKPYHIPMTLLEAPGLGHSFPPEWQKKAELEYAPYIAKGREEYPKKIRFVTYTLKYPGCSWLEILALERHYQKAFVEAEYSKAGLNGKFTVKTNNLRALTMRLPPEATRDVVQVVLDGQQVEARPNPAPLGFQVYLEKRAGLWRSVRIEKLITDRLRQPQKSNGQQGPIDDAFMSGFLCVRGTSLPWNAAIGQHTDADLERFEAEWSKYMRGKLPIKNDTEVTSADIAAKHLILFGDPASSSLIEEVMTGLPFQWTKDKITFHGKDYASSDHIPVLIYPSPLNPERYVVLNSGHTFHAEDFKGTNALLYPRLGDYAVLKRRADPKDPLAVDVAQAGLFDEFWHLPPQQ